MIRDKGIKGNLKVILIGIVILAVVVSGINYLTKHTAFDMEGGYIKDNVKDKDIIGYMNKAERVSYIDLITKPDDYLGKELKYYGVITDKEMHNDKSVDYFATIYTNEKEENQIKNKFDIPYKEHITLKFKLKAKKEYNTFSMGDRVIMYGDLIEHIEDESTAYDIPYLDLKALRLDEEFYEDSKED